MSSPAVRTPIYQVPELCGRCHGADVRIADFGKSGRGTAKGMRNRELLRSLEATQPGRQHTVFVQITMGNSGYDLAMEAREEQMRTGRRIDVVNIVPKGISPVVKGKLAECSFVHEMDLGRHITMAEMRKIAKELTGYEGPEEEILGVERYNLRDGYRAMIRQMAEEGLKPTHIVVPVGAGELLVEVAAEAEKVWGKDAPRIIGVTIQQNVLVHKEDFIKKPGRSIADKIGCAYSAVKELIKELVQRGRAELKVASDRQIYNEYRYLNETLGIEAEPSAAAAFAGAKSYGFKPGDTVVIINTGKGLFDEKAVEKFGKNRFITTLKEIAAGIAITASIVAAGLGIYVGYNAWQDYREEHRRLEHSVKAADEEYLRRVEREAQESAMRASSGRMRGYTVEEARAACELLGKTKEVCKDYWDESQFTPLEMYFLRQVYNLSMDNWARQDRQKLIDSWRNGTYHPDGHFYELYGNGEAPTGQ